MTGLALIEHLRSIGDLVPAILMTDEGDIAMAVRAVRSGASDFIERPVDRRELINSIERAVSQAPISRSPITADEAVGGRLAALTPRQRAVLDLVMAGQPSRNIAANLGISQRTVEIHRAQIMRKLGVRTIPHLVRAVLFATPA